MRRKKLLGSRDLVLESDDEFDDGSVEIMLLDDSAYLCWWIFVEKRKPCKKNTVDTVHVKETAMPEPSLVRYSSCLTYIVLEKVDL